MRAVIRPQMGQGVSDVADCMSATQASTRGLEVTPEMKEALSRLANLIQGSGRAQYKPTFQVAAQLSAAYGHREPAFVASSLEQVEEGDPAVRGSVTVFTSDLVARLESDRLPVEGWGRSGDPGELSIAVVPRTAIRRLSVVRPDGGFSGFDDDPTELAWASLIRVAYEGLGDVEVRKGGHRGDVDAFYQTLLADLASRRQS